MIKFKKTQTKSDELESKSPDSPIILGFGEIKTYPFMENAKEDIEKARKSELKYIQKKKAAGIFSALGSIVLGSATVSGINKSTKTKDSTVAIATCIIGLLSIGLGAGAVFTIRDAHIDKKSYNKRHFGK